MNKRFIPEIAKKIFIWGTPLTLLLELLVALIDTIFGYSGTYLLVILTISLHGFCAYKVATKLWEFEEKKPVWMYILTGILLVIYVELIRSLYYLFHYGEVLPFGLLPFLAGTIGGFIASRKKPKSNGQASSYPQNPPRSSKKLLLVVFLLFVTIATIGIGGYFLSSKKTQPSQPSKSIAVTKVQPTPPPSIEPTPQQSSKTYKNNTYGIEFQYDKDLVILYERKEGKTYIRGQLVGPQYKQNAINDQGPIVTLEDPTLTKKDGDFTVEIFPKDSDIGNCNNWTFNINSKKVFNGIEYQYAEFTGAYQTFSRHACVVHGDYTWLLAIDTQNKENLGRSGKILNEILSTFKFN